MIIPWKVDVPQDRLPFGNWLLIISIIAVFAWQIPQMRERHEKIEQIVGDKYSLTQEDVNSIKSIKVPYDDYMLDGWSFKGMFTHIRLHGGLMHIIGNLLFLWVFGNSVCAKIGNILYLPIYLFVGLCAGVSYLIFSGNMPMLGASGAINGIVGMYLVFFPTNEITCFWSMTLFYWKQFDAPSYIMILLWFAFDIFGAFVGHSNVAYFAHIGGFAAGVAIAIAMLKTNFIKMERYEISLLQVFENRKQAAKPKTPNWNRAIAGDFVPEQVQEQMPVAPKVEIPVISADAFFNQASAQPPELGAFLQPENTVWTGVHAAQTPAAPSPRVSVHTRPQEVPVGIIRFSCECGKKLKMPIQYAGKTGRCPLCKRPVKIPKA